MKKVYFLIGFIVLTAVWGWLMWDFLPGQFGEKTVNLPQQLVWTAIYLLSAAIYWVCLTTPDQGIPYVTKTRPDTGLTNAKLGIWLFLASEVMLFGALFSSYILLRVAAKEWPHGATNPLDWKIAVVNTVVLITSSVTMVMAWASLMMKDLKKFRLHMTLTVLLGLAFLVIKTFEYKTKISHDLIPSTNTFFAIYYTLTGLHVLHVIGGLIANIYLLGPGSAMWQEEPDRFTGRIEISGIYWHFVDLVWIFLFPVLYLL